MLSSKHMKYIARVLAGLTLVVGLFWLFIIAGMFRWAQKTRGNPMAALDEIPALPMFLIVVFSCVHLFAAWKGSKASVRGSFMMLGANTMSILATFFLNLPVVPNIKLMYIVTALLCGFLPVQILGVRNREQREVIEQ